MNYTKKEREQYNQDRQRACDRLGITVNDYNQFKRWGESLRSLYVEYCNTGKENEKEEVLLMRKIDNKRRLLHLWVFLQTDPRGATIYLDKKAIPENNYTQAVCIY
jgi:hypothetical protein